ncbi:hypothetical protein RBI22_02845 [Alcaligenaceae bacterium C4P045]|nr:hypothetical protein [Alcaligenaceae bacterium C4P045]
MVQPIPKRRLLQLLAQSSEGIEYTIERRCCSLPGDDAAETLFYSCLKDGQPVQWHGMGRYELPDGTFVEVVGIGSPYR